MRPHALRRFPENNQLLRIRVRQRAKEYSVDNREDGGVGADAESESEDGDEGEAGALAEHARGVADVLEEGLHFLALGGAEIWARVWRIDRW